MMLTPPPLLLVALIPIYSFPESLRLAWAASHRRWVWWAVTPGDPDPASPESQCSVSSPDEDAAEDTSPLCPHPQTRPPYSAHTGTRLLSLATCLSRLRAI